MGLNLSVSNGKYYVGKDGMKIAVADEAGGDEVFKQLLDTGKDALLRGIVSPKSVYYGITAHIMTSALYKSTMNPFKPTGSVTSWINQFLGTYEDVNAPQDECGSPESAGYAECQMRNEEARTRTKKTWAKTLLGSWGDKFEEGKGGVSGWMQSLLVKGAQGAG